jgi:hypothetical protein
MPQTSYSPTHLAAYLGGLADSDPTARFLTGLNKTGADIKYGLAVVVDATAGRYTVMQQQDYFPAKVPAAITDTILGVAVWDQAHNPNNTTGVLDGDIFSIVQRGRVYVWTEDAVDPTKPVHLRCIVNGGGTAPGQFRGTVDGVNTVAVPNARWAGKGGAGTIVALDLNLP